MRYAIISDIHSNLEALQAVLDRLAKENIQKYVCLGDVVGYGADPNECISLVQQLTDIVIAGNHDFATVGLTDINNFNPLAQEAALWTGKMLTPANSAYLKKLSLNVRLDDFFAVHATPNEPENWYYLFSTLQAENEFHFFDEPICFIGHSHQPIAFKKDDAGIYIIESSYFQLERRSRFIINVGSVGQPRDGNPSASFCIYDSTQRTINIIRIPYDIKTAQQKILRAGLPFLLAQRLAYGE